MTRLLTRSLLLLAVAFLLTACGNDTAEQPLVPEAPETPATPAKPLSTLSSTPVPLTTETKDEFADKSADFAFRLLKELSADNDADSNLAFSPLSLGIALGMLANGADEAVSADIAQLLGFGTNINQLNSFYRYVMQTGTQLAPEVTLALANNASFSQSVLPNSDFALRLKTFYDAEVMSLDFTSPSAIQTLNDWISQKTEMLIQDMLLSSDIDPFTTLILINALYFKAPWSSPFDVKNTKKELFSREDGMKQTLPIMLQMADSIQTFDNDLCQVATLPYGNQRKFGMTIFLPKDGHTVAELIDSLNGKIWQQLPSQMTKKYRALVKLPRFSIDSGRIQMLDLMKKMGTDATQWMLPFITADGETDSVQDIFQNATLSVDEQGAEGAAATVIRVGRGALPYKFSATRPFVYVVSDNQTGCIYFMGTYHGDKTP